jgi:hypothetical protein
MSIKFEDRLILAIITVVSSNLPPLYLIPNSLARISNGD